MYLWVLKQTDILMGLNQQSTKKYTHGSRLEKPLIL